MDSLKPQYHLTPVSNWMNDPNGAIYWNGRYHLFFQYNPTGAFSANKHWAHVVSTDMLHWEHLPVALAPTPGGYDAKGCFSGCTVINNGVPTIVYTGVMPEAQCLATSDSEMVNWTKYPGNPILSRPPAGLDVLTFRDPYVWKEPDGFWYMLLGSGIRNTGGACLLYRSTDLTGWQFIRPLLVGRMEQTGEMWHCPNFFQVGDRYALVVSSQPIWKPFFYTGTYNAHQFTPEKLGLVDHGGNLYAPQIFKDSQDRSILWGWMWEGRPDPEIRHAGWAGVMALPRQVELNSDGSLGFRPAPQVEQLRGRFIPIRRRRISSDQAPNTVYQGSSLEVWAHFCPGTATSFGLSVFTSPDDEEQTLIGYDREKHQLFIDRTRANLNPQMAFGWENQMIHSAPLDLLPGEELELHVYLDRSVIEVFANHGIVFSSRVYPSSDATGLKVFARNGEVELIHLDIWEIDPIYDGELTN